MRLLSTPVVALAALVALVSAQGQKLAAEDFTTEPRAAKKTQLEAAVATPASEKSSADPDFTVFNGQKVPKLKELGGDDLAALIESGYTLVKFYSPECHHCQAVAPVYQTLYEFYWTSKPLASSTTGDDSMNDFHHYYSFDFAAVNCIAFGDTCGKYTVRSFPTFILFKDSEIVESFTGARDMAGLSEFVEKHLESIRPGSRNKEGPTLPKKGDKVAPGFDAAAFAESQKAAESTSKSKSTTKAKRPNKSSPTPNIAGHSVELTAESFQNLVTMTQEPWFVKFYAPWCHHCQQMQPIWTQVGKEMKGKLNIGEVNCEVEHRLCKDVGVRAYPTIVFFRGGERVEYEGLRGLGDFISYANKALEVGEGVKDVDMATFKEMEETEEVIFVYFYDHATTSEDFIALERLTMSLIGHARLVKTNSAAMAERFKITTWPRLIVSRDGRPTYYTELEPGKMRDFRRVLEWMQSVWLPMVPELTASNSRDIMEGKIVVLGILTRDRPDEFLQAKKELKSAAMEWMDKQIQAFQLERQELRDAKQLRIEEAEDRNDQRALRSAKTIRIDMDRSSHKEVQFAWVDGVFWERWVRTTFGIDVKDGEKIIINDQDVSTAHLGKQSHTNAQQNHRYWDNTITGNYIIPSRTAILETIPKVVASPPKIKPKFTVSGFSRGFFEVRAFISERPKTTILLLLLSGATSVWIYRTKVKRRGGFFRLDDSYGEKYGANGILGATAGAKAD